CSAPSPTLPGHEYRDHPKPTRCNEWALFLWRLRMLALIFALLTPTADPTPTLEARIAPLAKAHKGKVAVAVKNLKTGESCYLNADEVMPTASLIKLPVMVE